MKFKIDKVTQLTSQTKLPRMVANVINYVKGLPDGTLTPTGTLMQKLTYSNRSIGFATHPALKAYRTKHPKLNTILWANKKTISAFRKSQYRET